MVNHRAEPIRVLVRSRQVPVEVMQVEVPYPTPLGQVLVPERVLRYARRLEPNEEAIVRAAENLARRTGAPLEVTDIAQEHVFARVIRGLRDLVAGAPRVSLPARVLPEVAEKPASVP